KKRGPRGTPFRRGGSAALALAHGGHGRFQLGGGDLAVLVGVDDVEALGRAAGGHPLVLGDGPVSVLVPGLDDVRGRRHLGRGRAGRGQQRRGGRGEDHSTHGYLP